MMNIPMLIMNIPIPYSPKTDDGIAIILLCCFLVSAYVLSRAKKFLWQQGSNFFLHKERTSIFSASTATDMHYLLLLVIQTCVLIGICFFNYFDNINPGLISHIPSYLLLGIYSAVCIIYILFKWLVYSFLGWVFFDKGTTDMWLESYSTLLYYVGFALFPFVLFLIYFDLNTDFMVIIGFGFIIIAKILIFYKWLKFFFKNIYGLLLLILYFCALEIIPCFIYYQVMIKINNLVLLKI